MNEDMVIQKLLEHDQRFDRLESELTRQIGGLRQEMLGIADYLIKMVKNQEAEQAAFRHAFMRHEDRITRLEIHNHLI